MSTAESVVVSQYWAKQMNEAGWPHEPTYFFWTKSTRKDSFWRCLPIVGAKRLANNQIRCKREIIAAPTAEEILRELPANIDGYLKIEMCDDKSGYRMKYQNKTNYGICEDTLANAAAAMWCYLAKKNLLQKP